MSRLLAAFILPLLAGAGAGLPHAQGTCTDTYTVMRGDTLHSIARLCGGSVSAIARASGVADPRRIEVGQRLVIRGAAPPPPGAGKDEPAAESPGPAYRMARGDTLYSLARWARVSLRALIAANPGIDPRKIEVGDAIRLPAGARDPGLVRARERGAARLPVSPSPPRQMPPPAPEDEDKPADGSEPEPAGM